MLGLRRRFGYAIGLRSSLWSSHIWLTMYVRLGEAYSHSGRRPSCASISLIVLPVCSVSTFASSGILASSIRASFESTLERVRGGALDQTPDSKTCCAFDIEFFTSLGVAETTLGNKRCIRYLI